MAATITSKGQITIPLGIRQRFALAPGDKLEFDASAPVLTARRLINRREWSKTLDEWKKISRARLKGLPWEKLSAEKLVDDLRGGPADKTEP
ncbi:MAG: AbrB/MazE/SpoVT family DNA-binding domain-containing protein [Verrucomicrobiae bacterium]